MERSNAGEMKAMRDIKPRTGTCVICGKLQKGLCDGCGKRFRHKEPYRCTDGKHHCTDCMDEIKTEEDK